jgi:hypothetical protein
VDPARIALATPRVKGGILLNETTGPDPRINYIIFFARKKPPFGNFFLTRRGEPVVSRFFRLCFQYSKSRAVVKRQIK